MILCRHYPATYASAFVALAMFRSTRQEAFAAWDKEDYRRAFASLHHSAFWWDIFLIRRARVRAERRHGTR